MRPRPEVETCSVVDQFCTSPANLVPPVPARGRCYSCGLPVCAKCSTRRKYLRFGVQRVCNNCQVQVLDGNDSVVMRRLHRLAH